MERTANPLSIAQRIKHRDAAFVETFAQSLDGGHGIANVSKIALNGTARRERFEVPAR